MCSGAEQLTERSKVSSIKIHFVFSFFFQNIWVNNGCIFLNQVKGNVLEHLILGQSKTIIIFCFKI